MAVINSLEKTAANDVPEAQVNDSKAHQISLEAIEKMIQLRLNTSVLSAKAEIAAGLDGVSHQLLQTQQERLTIAERSLKQHLKPLQTQLIELADDNALFKRIQTPLQKQMMVIADKVSRKKVDILAKENARKIQELEEQQNNLVAEIANQSQMAMLKGMIGGAFLGAAIAIAAGFII
jgi:hypothetical protein